MIDRENELFDRRFRQESEMFDARQRARDEQAVILALARLSALQALPPLPFEDEPEFEDEEIE